MTCVHKASIKKKMTTATNEDCIGWLDEHCYMMGEGMIFLIAEDVNLSAVIVSCLDVTGPNLGH